MASAGVFTYRYEGRDLRVEDLGTAWRLTSGDRVAEAPFLDRAIAEALRLDTAAAVALARRILDSRADDAA